MPSTRLELRASASENVLRLLIVFLSASEFSDRIVSSRCSTVRAACVMFWPASGSATSSGGLAAARP